MKVFTVKKIMVMEKHAFNTPSLMAFPKYIIIRVAIRCTTFFLASNCGFTDFQRSTTCDSKLVTWNNFSS